MALSFRVLPEHGLVYARYEGNVRIEESDRAFGEYLAHPDYKPGQKQLIDLSRIVDFDRDYTKIMALQSRKAEGFVGVGVSQTLVVYLAPTETSAKLARIVQKSWDGVNNMIALIAKEESEAMSMLGFEGVSLSEILAPANA